MQSNGLLKWLMIPVVLMFFFVLIKVFSGKKDEASFDNTPRLTAEEMKALGIEGDTPRDTLATLVGQVKQLRTELQDTKLSYQEQKAENERLRNRESGMDQRIDSALKAERDRLQQEQETNRQERQQTTNLLGQLQQRLEGMSHRVELPVGLGLEGVQQTPPETLAWVEPLDVKPGDGRSNNSLNTPSFATSFSTANPTDRSLHAGERIRHENYSDKADLVKPVYTVPSNSTLMGSVAMSALIGRVPVDGTVSDPYPFKVLVGPDNLTANGIELPDVAGAVLSGSASGDWTLSCVRGQITSITFVFNDGTIRTVPKPGTGDSNQNSNRNTSSGGLGWISDPHGVPCVAGERKSNAAEYIGNQSLVTAAGAGVAYLLRDKEGNAASYSNTGNIITGMDAVGQILQGGVKDISTWMNKLYGQAFAAVYVQPGAKVAVHLEQEIHIDFDSQGRKVDSRIGGTHVAELD